MLSMKAGATSTVGGAESAIVFNPTPQPTYQTIMGNVTIPSSGPFNFSDGFVAVSEAELQAMSLDQLLGYSNVVSTSAGLEYSTLLANQNIKSQFDTLISLSQSTLSGLSNEITSNTGIIKTANQTESNLLVQSTIYASTLAKYHRNLFNQSNTVRSINSTITSLKNESASIDSTIAYQNSTFISSAIGYSTLYRLYEGWDIQVKKQISLIESTKSTLSSVILAESTSYQNLLNSTSTWKVRSAELSTLYNTSNSIQSTLTQYRINEVKAVGDHEISVRVISTLSTLYNAAIVNQKYAQALSTQTVLANAYVNAMSTFTMADIAYSNSIPQRGGAASGASGPVLGNSVLWAARSLAEQQMNTAKENMNNAEKTTLALQTLAGIANTDLYNKTIVQLEETVQIKVRAVNTFKSYKESSLQSVVRFSSIYEQARTDVATNAGQLSLYSSLYESSLIGSSTLLGLYNRDYSTILLAQAAADARSYTISSLNRDYSNYISSYGGYVNLSSIYSQQANSSMKAVSSLSTLYNSTTLAISQLNSTASGLQTAIINAAGTLYSQSTILNRELINLAGYDAQVKDSVNVQELSAYQYRETYCRTLRIGAQNTYERLILGAIQAASTTTSQQQALYPSTTINPIAPNLNTPAITESYNSLTGINSFLGSFSNVYNTFNTQQSNIRALSTSVGYQASAWSTFATYNDLNYYANYKNAQAQAMVNTTIGQYLTQQGAVKQALQGYSNAQGTIASVKQQFSTTYRTFFSPADIYAQENTISSFMIQGYQQALSNLAKQGVIYSL